MKAVIGGIVLLFAATGCGGTPEPAAGHSTSPSPTGASSLATAAAAPTPSPSATPSGPRKLGQTFVTKDVKITALQYRRGAPGYGAGAGRRWDALLVKTCIVGHVSTLSWAPWSLVDAGSGMYPASSSTYDGFLVPQYPFAGNRPFHKGDCAKGWIYFEVGKDARLSRASYANSVGNEAEWRLR